jgi:hypothetical protein
MVASALLQIGQEEAPRMSRRRSLPFHAALIAALAVALVAAGSLSAGATVTPKRFTMVVAPATVGAGSTTAFSVTFANQSSVQLGAINLHVPPPLVITAVSSPRGTWSLAGFGKNVQFRNLSLPAGQSFTATVTAKAPCADSYLTWTVMARQGNNYSGATFGLNAGSSAKTTTITGACHLEFTDSGQPTNAHPDETITSTPFDTGGGPVEVEALDGLNNQLLVSIPITVAIGANPGPGMLSGTTLVTSSGGVADYSDLSIDTPGIDYTLIASSPGYVSGESATFTIAMLDVSCEPNVDCIGTLEDDTTSATVNAMADPFATDLLMSLVPGGPDCQGGDGDYEESSSTVIFSVTGGTRVKQVSITIDSGTLPIEGFDPSFRYQVCYESPTPFTDRFGAENVNVGLLPDCDSEFPESTAPCLLSKSFEGSVVTVTFLAPSGDPKGRV